ncbi:Hypothetical predicted protein [Podarcis lilfordi]|uniref:Uncharacterized protein n=1 Tax=Podarcis lilfordi TaxID=74358 RepID=A0AA35PN59_9SAUR|nr:Hypothetical predicted protein [Podarcis lilfordi]
MQPGLPTLFEPNTRRRRQSAARSGVALTGQSPRAAPGPRTPPLSSGPDAPALKRLTADRRQPRMQNIGIILSSKTQHIYLEMRKAGQSPVHIETVL